MENYFRIRNELQKEIIRSCGPTAFGVFTVLAQYANQTGKCWPSIEHIATELEMSTRTINRAIESLCDNGYIERQKYGRNSNLYHIPNAIDNSKNRKNDNSDTTNMSHLDMTNMSCLDTTNMSHYKEVLDKEVLDKEKIQNNKGDIVNVTKLLDRVLSFDEYVREMEANDPDRFTSCAAVLDALRIYFSMYRRIMREEHPRLRVSQWGKHIEDIIEFQTPEGKVSFFECDPEDIFEKYFNTEFNPGNGQRCDYRLPHFCSMANSCNFLYEASMA